MESKHLPRISKGYRYVYAPESADAAQFGSYKGYVLEHRLVMERKLGRPLSAKEDVHHIDFNTLNNETSNLMLLSSSDHSRLHKLLKYGILSIDDCHREDKVRAILRDNHAKRCSDCGAELSISQSSIQDIVRCPRCAMIVRRKCVRPTKEVLIEQLKGQTMQGVAKLYGLTSNAVKKWVIQYGIDFKSLVKPVGFSAKANERSRTKEANEKRRKSLSEWHRVHDNSSCKPVVCLTQDGKVTKEYRRIADAKKDGFCDSMISRCCLGKCKTYKGLVWQYQNPTSPTNRISKKTKQNSKKE